PSSGALRSRAGSTQFHAGARATRPCRCARLSARSLTRREQPRASPDLARSAPPLQLRLPQESPPAKRLAAIRRELPREARCVRILLKADPSTRRFPEPCRLHPTTPLSENRHPPHAVPE